jgi:hypothetical protein
MNLQRFRLLVRLFSRRFFENDLLAPDIDLRPSAIFLLAALAAPPFLWTVKGIVRFGLLSIHGYQAVEIASWFDKSLLMMLAMVSAGIVTVLSWEALLVDRRDALILGSLPISSRWVVVAKAVALARLFGVVASLNLPSLFILSVGAYSHFSGGLVLRACVAHAVAVSAASLGTSLVLTAALVTVTAIFEGRWLRVMTVAVQSLVLVSLTGLLLGFQWGSIIGAAARAGDPAALGWMAFWPPGWFVGLSQVVLGKGPGQAVFSALARPALLMSLVALCVCVPATLLLWRRALRVMVSAAPGEAPGRAWSMTRSLPAWLAGPPLDRAFIQFFLAVIWRSPRHRLAVLTAAGLAIAVVLEGTLVLNARVPGSARWLTEYVVPVLVLVCLLGIFRWLLTLPAELPASWVLGLVTPASGAIVRRALGRVLFVLTVGPTAMLAGVLSWWQGSMVSALAHAALVTLAGLGMVEYALTRVTFMPFATEYLPGRSNLKARWPVHAVVLLVIVPILAGIERALLATPGTPLFVTMVIGVAMVGAAVIRRRRRADLLTADPGTGADWRPVQLRIGWV